MPRPNYVIFNPHPLFEAAKAAGHTTDDAVASHLGLDPSVVSRIRRGERQPGPDNFWKVVDGYGLDPETLIIRIHRLDPPGVRGIALSSAEEVAA